MAYTHPQIGQDPWGDDLLTGLDELDSRITALETTGGTPGPEGPTGPTGPSGPAGDAGSGSSGTGGSEPTLLLHFIGSVTDLNTVYPPASWTNRIMIYYPDSDHPNIVMSNGVHWVTANNGYWQNVETIV